MGTKVLIQFCSANRQLRLFALLMLFLPIQAHAIGAIVEKASTRLQNEVYQLNADIRYELSDEILEALNNGIALSMQVTIRVEHPRTYFWNHLIIEKSPHYQLKFHALSGQYLVQSSDGDQRSYLSLNSALRALGQIRGLPLLDKELLLDPQDVMVSIRAELDTNALPAPLRPVAWLSGQWKLSSEWFTCPLRY